MSSKCSLPLKVEEEEGEEEEGEEEEGEEENLLSSSKEIATQSRLWWPRGFCPCVIQFVLGP